MKKENKQIKFQIWSRMITDTREIETIIEVNAVCKDELGKKGAKNFL